MFFGFATEITEITNFFGNCHWNLWLHRFYALIFFFVKALRQWSHIREAMKRLNVNYGKKLKQWSNEAFNAGKEIEAMNCLTLHRFYCPALHIITAFKAITDITENLVIKTETPWKSRHHGHHIPKGQESHQCHHGHLGHQCHQCHNWHPGVLKLHSH
jgi:hypothetical protein